jgi:hypothetical protein
MVITILVTIAVVVALGVVGIWLGARNKAVFYTGGWDVFVSLVSLYSVFVALALLNQESLGDQDVRVMATYAVVGLAVIYNYAKSFQYNGWLRGMCVFCGRIVMPLLVLFAIPNLSDRGKGGYGIVSAVVSLGIAAGVALLVHRLINGDTILSEKRNCYKY